MAVNVLNIERLSTKKHSAIQMMITLPEGTSHSGLRAALLDVSRLHYADVALQKDNINRWSRRLIVFNMDSTLIEQDVFDELAKFANVEVELHSIKKAEERGELDFLESLKARVMLLQGQNAAELFEKVRKSLTFTRGAKKLCMTLKTFGYKMAVVSVGFHPLAREVQHHLGLDYVFANSLEVDESGNLTGCTAGPVVTPQRKRALLAMIANVEGCEVAQTIAVGYGAHDAQMLDAAGLGIPFSTKPDHDRRRDEKDGASEKEMHINQKDLGAVLFLVGLSEHAAERFCSHTEDSLEDSKLPSSQDELMLRSIERRNSPRLSGSEALTLQSPQSKSRL